MSSDAVINDRMDVNDWLRKQLEAAEPDLLGEMVQSFAETLGIASLSKSQVSVSVRSPHNAAPGRLDPA